MSKVLVTGGTKGIGAAIASHLQSLGHEVFTCARSEGGTFVCDVTQRDQVQLMREKVGPVDILVNNAGGVQTTSFLKMTEEQWDWHFQLNLKSIFYCTQAFLPAMLDNGWGRIINIASTAGLTGGPYISAYVASKHAVIGLTRSLALEVADKGVTVNAVCPTYVDTPMLRNSADLIAQKTGRKAEEIVDSLAERNPQKRLVMPEEVAISVQFLIDSPGVNGQSIPICGGSTI